MNKLPSIEYLKEAVDYDASSPTFLRWKHRPRNHFNTSRGYLIFTNRSAGNPAGHKARSGDGREYLYIKIDQIKYPAHRIVFALTTGIDPGDREIDHINRDSLNNSLSNLRLATRQENARNKNLPSNNTSGKKGVTWCKRTGRWMAQLGHENKTLFLGRYKDLRDAVAARLQAAARIHKEYANEEYVAHLHAA